MARDPRSDEELVAAHAAGEPDCLAELVRRYSPELFGFVLRYVANGTAAEDLIQEAFVQVHTSAESFDPERRFKPWLYTIAANKARDWLRSRKRRSEQSLDASDGDSGRGGLAEQLPDAGAPVEEDLARAEQAEQVRALIERMPEHLREILILGYYQQLPYAEIAEILAIPLGTVKSRLHSAVSHFARLWREREPNDADVVDKNDT